MRGVIAAAIVAGVVAVSGCSGGAEPDPIDDGGDAQQAKQEKSGSDEPKPTKTDKADDDGKVIDKGDDSGPIEDTSPEDAAKAEDLVERYFAALNKATGNGDFSKVDPLFTEGCTACMDSKSYITSVYDGGGRIKGGTASNVQATAGETNTQNGHIKVDVQIDASAWERLNASGNSEEGDSAKQEKYEFFVSNEDGRWRIVAGSFQG